MMPNGRMKMRVLVLMIALGLVLCSRLDVTMDLERNSIANMDERAINSVVHSWAMDDAVSTKGKLNYGELYRTLMHKEAVNLLPKPVPTSENVEIWLGGLMYRSRTYVPTPEVTSAEGRGRQDYTQEVINPEKDAPRMNTELTLGEHHLQVEPSALDFGVKDTCIPAMLSVNLTHILEDEYNDEPLVIESIVIEQKQFLLSDIFKPIVLKQGEVWQTHIIFLPTTLGLIRSNMIIKTSYGNINYQLQGEGKKNQFKVMQYTATIPAGVRYEPLINLNNPFNATLRIKEVFTTEGFLHMTLPMIEIDASGVWEIPPLREKAIMKLSFLSLKAGLYSAYVRIETDRENLIIPVELTVLKEGLYPQPKAVDFGFYSTIDESHEININLVNTGSRAVQIISMSLSHPDDSLSIVIRNDYNTVPSKSKLHNAIILSFRASKSGTFTGELTFYTNETISSLAYFTVPYTAIVLQGAVTYNRDQFYFPYHLFAERDFTRLTSTDAPTTAKKSSKSDRKGSGKVRDSNNNATKNSHLKNATKELNPAKGNCFKYKEILLSNMFATYLKIENVSLIISNHNGSNEPTSANTNDIVSLKVINTTSTINAVAPPNATWPTFKIEYSCQHELQKVSNYFFRKSVMLLVQTNATRHKIPLLTYSQVTNINGSNPIYLKRSQFNDNDRKYNYPTANITTLQRDFLIDVGKITATGQKLSTINITNYSPKPIVIDNIETNFHGLKYSLETISLNECIDHDIYNIAQEYLLIYPNYNELVSQYNEKLVRLQVNRSCATCPNEMLMILPGHTAQFTLQIRPMLNNTSTGSSKEELKIVKLNALTFYTKHERIAFHLQYYPINGYIRPLRSKVRVPPLYPGKAATIDLEIENKFPYTVPVYGIRVSDRRLQIISSTTELQSQSITNVARVMISPAYALACNNQQLFQLAECLFPQKIGSKPRTLSHFNAKYITHHDISAYKDRMERYSSGLKVNPFIEMKILIQTEFIQILPIQIQMPLMLPTLFVHSSGGVSVVNGKEHPMYNIEPHNSMDMGLVNMHDKFLEQMDIVVHNPSNVTIEASLALPDQSFAHSDLWYNCSKLHNKFRLYKQRFNRSSTTTTTQHKTSELTERSQSIHANNFHDYCFFKWQKHVSNMKYQMMNVRNGATTASEILTAGIFFLYEKYVNTSNFILLRPGETQNIGVAYFAPMHARQYNATFYIRNTLTHIEPVHVSGIGGLAAPTLIGGKLNSTIHNSSASLQLKEIGESVRHWTPTNKNSLISFQALHQLTPIREKVYFRNDGNVALNISSAYIKHPTESFTVHFENYTQSLNNATNLNLSVYPLQQIVIDIEYIPNCQYKLDSNVLVISTSASDVFVPVIGQVSTSLLTVCWRINTSFYHSSDLHYNLFTSMLCLAILYAVIQVILALQIVLKTNSNLKVEYYIPFEINITDTVVDKVSIDMIKGIQAVKICSTIPRQAQLTLSSIRSETSSILCDLKKRHREVKSNHVQALFTERKGKSGINNGGLQRIQKGSSSSVNKLVVDSGEPKDKASLYEDVHATTSTWATDEVQQRTAMEQVASLLDLDPEQVTSSGILAIASLLSVGNTNVQQQMETKCGSVIVVEGLTGDSASPRDDDHQLDDPEPNCTADNESSKDNTSDTSDSDSLHSFEAPESSDDSNLDDFVDETDMSSEKSSNGSIDMESSANNSTVQISSDDFPDFIQKSSIDFSIHDDFAIHDSQRNGNHKFIIPKMEEMGTVDTDFDTESQLFTEFDFLASKIDQLVNDFGSFSDDDDNGMSFDLDMNFSHLSSSPFPMSTKKNSYIDGLNDTTQIPVLDATGQNSIFLSKPKSELKLSPPGFRVEDANPNAIYVKYPGLFVQSESVEDLIQSTSPSQLDQQDTTFSSKAWTKPQHGTSQEDHLQKPNCFQTPYFSNIQLQVDSKSEEKETEKKEKFVGYIGSKRAN